MPTKQHPLKVFISYASQDELAVREVYNALKLQNWLDPWLDKEKILPGQDWRAAIETAVEEADVVIICLSSQLVNKEGFIQREIRYAYEIALEKPEGTIFLIPMRLDPCDLPRGLRSLQRVDYFGAEKHHAFSDLLQALKLRYQQKSGTKTEDHAAQGSIVVAHEADLIKDGNSVAGLAPKTGPKAAEHRDKESGRKSAKKPSSKADPTIIAALIGVAGTIIVTLISLFANRPAPGPTPTLAITIASTSTEWNTPVFTETALSATATFTSVPPTDTLVPTVTVISPVSLGEDWTAGCISTLWRPYPADIQATEKGDGCWREPVHIFSAENGDLDFLAQKRNASSEIYGLFAPLPERGIVTVKIRLRDLTNVDLWMGVFAEPDVTSQGLLMIIPSGDVRRRVFVQKDLSNYETINSTSVLTQGNGFSISFSFDENSARSTVNPSVFVTTSVSVPSSQKWLFLGYKGLGGSYRLDGTFLSFEIR